MRPSVALLDVLGDLLEGGALAALEADLDDATSAAFCAAASHGLAFADVVGQRLFAVDVQPLLEGGDELQGVPVRRRGDDDGLEAGDVEQFAGSP